MQKIPRLIAALDVETAAGATGLVAALAGAVDYFKVGSRLFTAEGPGMIRELKKSGVSVFLDLKFHDIPATVAGSVRAAAGLGVDMMTIHACGGLPMMRAAAEAAAETSLKNNTARPLIVGVTVLTSMSSEDLIDVSFYEGDVESLVLRRAKLAAAAGLDGVVASVREASAIRKELGPEFVIVTPGIRPAGADSGDQKRVASPGAAMESGSSFIVVGRPIYDAPSPRDAAEAILAQLRGK